MTALHASDDCSAENIEREAWRLLESVPDPEIPILSVVDLGIVRYLRSERGERLVVGVSPTYTGCPATEVIQASIKAKLAAAGFGVTIESVLAPPWSSDWLTDRARSKLRDYGIAPPARSVSNAREIFAESAVSCPRCSSSQTECVSEFGSTPCKSLYRCTVCREPFEAFKCI